MTHPRTIASVWAAKGTAYASRALRRGGGTAASGLVGLTLQPGLIAELASQLGEGCVIVTGTNGKTTTSLLINNAARESGLDVLANASGSNLMRGVASTLALAAGPDGRLLDPEQRLGVFEMDEAAMTVALPHLKPRAVVFTNLFRDQLDRYGEVDAVASRWRAALARAPKDLHLVLNADDPSIALLGEGHDSGSLTYFGVEGKALGHDAPDHAADALTCLCGARLEYAVAFYGHVGHWRCPACKRKRPKPHIAARRLNLKDGRTATFELTLSALSPDPSPRGRGEPEEGTAPSRNGANDVENPLSVNGEGAGGGVSRVSLPLGGLYNVYNALAAVACTTALGIPQNSTLRALESATAAFGRQEAFEVDGRRVELFLGKNPAGLNQVLQTLMLDPARKTALFVLNDGIADGRDVSWVWDADFEVAAGKLERVITSGTRAAEMALRLKYAEWPEPTLEVDPDIARALDRAIALTPDGACLTIVPTYTAMLTVRELLAKRTGKQEFWRE
jgi:UDP-N-acetylmuramyl tripeptide synthase